MKSLVDLKKSCISSGIKPNSILTMKVQQLPRSVPSDGGKAWSARKKTTLCPPPKFPGSPLPFSSACPMSIWAGKASHQAWVETECNVLLLPKVGAEGRLCQLFKPAPGGNVFFKCFKS